MLYRETWKPAAVVFLTSVITSCGGGSSGTTPADPDSATRPSVVPADVLPLESSEGAETGLRGCLNRPLFYNGPHFVSRSYTETITGEFGATSSTKTIDEIYDVVSVGENGISEVGIDTTTMLSNGNGGTYIAAVELDGYTVTILGVQGSTPSPNPIPFNFDLDAGESVSQPEAGASTTATTTYTYVGRENITIVGKTVAACRVDTLIFDESELPQFQRIAIYSDWYGVGTGLELKAENVGYPDSEQDALTTIRTLTSANINSIQIF